MSKKISGSEYPLAKIFSSEFEYAIPTYQRPYAWETEQATTLLDDLYDFFEANKDEDYFLGNIVLIKEEEGTRSEVIDGQQRLTTLTILLAIIASKMKGEQKKDILEYILEPGRESQGLKPKPRLTLRSQDEDFFKSYVQELKFEELFELDEKQLKNEAQINIKRNSLALHTKIMEIFSGDIEKLKDFRNFLIQRCFIITVTVSNQNTALRIFSVMNSRGLDLQETDIIKADIIGFLKNETEQISYSKRWEGLEIEIGREGFKDLFSHIRMIYAKEKAKHNILKEFRKHVFPKNNEPEKFINEILTPYVRAYNIVKNSAYTAETHTEEVNHYLKWLNRIGIKSNNLYFHRDWLPAAIQFTVKNKNNPEYMADFFKQLERLAAYMYICKWQINDRIKRYKPILSALEKPNSIGESIRAAKLNDLEKQEMLKTLDSEIYNLTQGRMPYIILRLDSFVADGAAIYDGKRLTIEHVLPQTVKDNSDWAKKWPDPKERQAWCHRLANLVSLNKARNTKAGNYDFQKKKTDYFSGNKNISSYALTTQVLKESSWTLEVVQKRQAHLLEVFKDKDNWDLKCSC